jgi:hypothetical protein
VKIILLLAALALPALAADTPDMIIDNIVWYNPDGGHQPFRAGTISPGSGYEDYVDGTAVCNPNYPFPPPLFTEIVDIGLGAYNQQPICGSLGYFMIGSAFSARSDGNYDHLKDYGFALYPNQPGRPPNTPEVGEWHAACSAEGTDAYGNPNGHWATGYLVSHTSGSCWPPV